MNEDYYEEDTQRWKNGISLNNDAGLAQAYASWKYRISPQLTMVSGLHYTQFLLNDAKKLEPRAALNWHMNTRQSLNFGYGQHSIVESIITHYATVYDEAGFPSTPNVNLDLTRSDHYENLIEPGEGL